MRKFIRRLFIAFLGFFVLLVAALTLWIARGPQATESRTTGGVLYTAQEVAAPLFRDGNRIYCINNRRFYQFRVL